MKNFSFSYRERLHLQTDFNKVFKNGKKLEHKALRVIVYRRKDGGHLRRLGLVTSRKVGTAAVRNRTKRRLREIFRTNKHLLKTGLDIIFVSKQETASQDYNTLKNIILDLFKGAGFYRNI